MSARVIEYGKIEGTRTTVYHVLDYSTMNWTPEQITEWLPITVEQVNAALEYIEANKTHVMAEYQKMLDRCARGNPPEIEERLNKRRVLMRAWFKMEDERAQNNGGREHFCVEWFSPRQGCRKVAGG